MKITFHVLLAATLAIITFPGFAADPPAGPNMPPDAALKKLMAGNARFVSGKTAHPNQGRERRVEVRKGQKPFAIVAGCADSRTSPEILFDQGFGDVFVTRIAGNIVDDAALGSIEYGIAHLGASVILVLGHEYCGAVDAAMKGGRLPGKLGAFVKPILPAVKAVKKSGTPTLEAAIDENARLVAAGLAKRSAIVADAVKAGNLKIVAAFYDMDTGKVRLLH
jgi:carbonic anhydrase